MSSVEFPFRTGKVTIDLRKCEDCRTFACVKACSLFGTSILRMAEGKPSLIPTCDEARRRCNECLACERFCKEYGAGGLEIDLPIPGLENCSE